jgi:hypothetical protein
MPVNAPIFSIPPNGLPLARYKIGVTDARDYGE